METDSIKTYTDEASLKDIFNNSFSRFHTYLKKQDSAQLVKFKDYADGNVSFIVGKNEIKKNSLIFCRDNSNNSIFAYLELLNKQEENTYLFKPLKVVVSYSPRLEERKILNPQGIVSHRIYMINMISEFIIRNSLDVYKKTISHIEKTIKFKLDKLFTNIRIFFINYGKDIRMEYFKKNITPIFIQDINKEPDEKNKNIYNFYLNEVLPAETETTGDKKLISEIAVPIVYNMKIAYGFVRVNSSLPFDESSMQIIKKMAVIVNELLKKHNIFPKSEDRIQIFDISKNGIGIIFKDKKCFKYFSEDQLLYFDLLLPDNKKVNVLSQVRNVLIKGNHYQVGCKIIDIDALSEVHFDEYLQSIGVKTSQ